MRLTALLLFITSLAFGQDVDKAIKYLEQIKTQAEQIKVQADSAIVALKPAPPPVKTYTPFPVAPDFLDPVTITTTATGFNIDDKKLAGKTDVIFTTGTTQSISNTWKAGTAVKPVRFKGTDVVISGPTTSTKTSFNGITYPRHVEVYDLTLEGNHGAFQWPGGDASNPSTILLTSVKIRGPNFAGFWVNNELKYYDKVNSNFLRVENSGGEALYIGSTKKTALSIIKQSHHTNLLVVDAGWDGVQITSAEDLLIDHATVIAGRLNKDEHNRSAQFHFCHGEAKNSIFISTGAMNIFSSGLTISNCYIKWTNPNYSIYVGQHEAITGTLPLTFDNVVFDVAATAAIFNTANSSYELIVKNSIIAGSPKLFSGSGRVKDGGGNKFVDKVPAPVLENYLVTDEYYYGRGIGDRTPDK